MQETSINSSGTTATVLCQILKRHKFQSAMNVPFYSYFCPTVEPFFYDHPQNHIGVVV